MREDKRAVRQALRALEARISPDEWRSVGDGVCERLLRLPEYQRARCVCCFVGGAREIDTTRVLRKALKDGKTLCAPACLGPGVMEMRQIESLSLLRPGAYQILEPPKNARAIRASEMDFVIVPCLSCTYGGERLGKGGGYYDRFLAAYAGDAAMLCPEALISPSLPLEAHDRKVSLVVTEASVYRNGVPVP